MIPVHLVATGKALSSLRFSAESLDRMLGRPAGYTFKNGGVRIRHFASETESQSRLGAAALADALGNASLQASSIELLIAACGVPEQALPSTACFIAEYAGLDRGTPAFDVNAGCLSFLTGMAHAAKNLGLALSRIMGIYETHGNQVAASIPTALHEAVMSGRAQPGSRILMMGTAAGLTVGGLVLDL